MGYPHKPSGGGHDWDDSDVEAVPSDTDAVKALKRKRSGTGGSPTKPGLSVPFVRGPIPVPWIKACRETHPEALALALAIKAREGRYPAGRVPVGDFVARSIGLSEVTRRRALAALEAAGLVDVVREPGRAPSAKLLPWPDTASKAMEGAANG